MQPRSKELSEDEELQGHDEHETDLSASEVEAGPTTPGTSTQGPSTHATLPYKNPSEMLHGFATFAYINKLMSQIVIFRSYILIEFLHCKINCQSAKTTILVRFIHMRDDRIRSFLSDCHASS